MKKQGKQFLNFKPLAVSRRDANFCFPAAVALFGVKTAAPRRKACCAISTANRRRNRPAAKLVMIDPGHGGIDSGAVGHEGSQENTSCWKSPTTCAVFCMSMTTSRRA